MHELYSVADAVVYHHTESTTGNAMRIAANHNIHNMGGYCTELRVGNITKSHISPNESLTQNASHNLTREPQALFIKSLCSSDNLPQTHASFHTNTYTHKHKHVYKTINTTLTALCSVYFADVWPLCSLCTRCVQFSSTKAFQTFHGKLHIFRTSHCRLRRYNRRTTHRDGRSSYARPPEHDRRSNYSLDLTTDSSCSNWTTRGCL